MTSFTDPMQELNQKVLEKQAHALLAEIESTMLSGNLPAAFERLYFYISQNHSSQAASLIIKKFPATAVVFSARDALLAFANRDKALACWQAFIEAEKLVNAGSFDEATALLRRARTGFAGAPEFAKVQDAWSTAKAEQLRQALMRGDEHTAKRVEKEIDSEVVTDPVHEEIDHLFSIESRDIVVTHQNGNIEFHLDTDSIANTNVLESFDDDRVCFLILREEAQHIGLLVYDAVTNKAFMHSLTGISFNESTLRSISVTYNEQFVVSNNTLKSIPGSRSEYYLIIHETKNLLRLKLDGHDSSVTAICDLHRHIAFVDEKGDEKWIENFIPFDRDGVLIHFRNENEYIHKLFMLRIMADTIATSNEFESMYGGDLFTNGTKAFAIFHDFSGLECYDRNLKHHVKSIDQKYDYFQNVKVDYRSKQIYLIAACRAGENERPIFDLLVLNFDFKIVNRSENIYPYHDSMDMWLNYDFRYDVENELIYFSEMSSYCAYNFVSKTFITSTSVPIFLYVNASKATFRDTFDKINKKIVLENQTEKIMSAKNHILTNQNAALCFNAMLKNIGLAFYNRYLEPIRQAKQENLLEKYLENAIQHHDQLIGNSEWKSEEMVFFTNGLQAIATAVHEGYDRDL
ncbi:MAG TPA: hypothetical protein HPP97_14630 [Desulfuromonadales bacterium]|nr:hypothetical protein [Desulfuromonadales bacterium]